MTLAPAAASALMLAAKASSPVKAVAKSSAAPGARSWTICAIPRPSSAPAASESSRTSTGAVDPQGLPGPGRSPLGTSPAAGGAAEASRSKESERIPTVTPLPSTPKLARALAAFSCVSPSDLTAPPQSLPRTIGVSTSVTAPTPATSPIAGRSAGGAATVTVWYAPLTWTISAPAARRAPSAAAAPLSKRTSARTRLPSRRRLPGPLAARPRRAACSAGGAARTAGAESSASRGERLGSAGGADIASAVAGVSAQRASGTASEAGRARGRGVRPGVHLRRGIDTTGYSLNTLAWHSERPSSDVGATPEPDQQTGHREHQAADPEREEGTGAVDDGNHPLEVSDEE